MIFCIGANKTGTSSLREALKFLNVGKVCPEHLGYQIIHTVYKKQYKQLFQLCNQYDVFQDIPYNLSEVYKVLDDVYQAQFILTLREPEAWFHSLVRSSNDNTLEHRDSALYHWKEFGNQDAKISPHKQKYIDAYNKRNDEIIDYFRDLLVIKTEDMRWEPLCHYLDVDTPRSDFPHLNKS